MIPSAATSASACRHQQEAGEYHTEQQGTKPLLAPRSRRCQQRHSANGQQHRVEHSARSTTCRTLH
jgi:hypothetical protein